MTQEGSIDVDKNVEEAVAEFIRLDDEIKRARKQTKECKDVMDQHKAMILKYMVKTKTDRLTGINGGLQYIECSKKTLRKRPTSEQMLQKLQELLSQGIMDPMKIMEELMACGTTYTDYRLFRRSKKVPKAQSDAPLSVKKGKKKQQTTGKRKKRTIVTQKM